jgi:hypothetical protein
MTHSNCISGFKTMEFPLVVRIRCLEWPRTDLDRFNHLIYQRCILKLHHEVFESKTKRASIQKKGFYHAIAAPHLCCQFSKAAGGMYSIPDTGLRAAL